MVENSHTKVERTHPEMVEKATWRWRKNPHGSVRERSSYLGEKKESMTLAFVIHINNSYCFLRI